MLYFVPSLSYLNPVARLLNDSIDSSLYPPNAGSGLITAICALYPLLSNLLSIPAPILFFAPDDIEYAITVTDCVPLNKYASDIVLNAIFGSDVDPTLKPALILIVELSSPIRKNRSTTFDLLANLRTANIRAIFSTITLSVLVDKAN